MVKRWRCVDESADQWVQEETTHADYMERSQIASSEYETKAMCVVPGQLARAMQDSKAFQTIMKGDGLMYGETEGTLHSQRHSVALFDLGSGVHVRTLRYHAAPIKSLAPVANGRLACACGDNIVLWRIKASDGAPESAVPDKFARGSVTEQQRLIHELSTTIAPAQQTQLRQLGQLQAAQVAAKDEELRAITADKDAALRLVAEKEKEVASLRAQLEQRSC